MKKLCMMLMAAFLLQILPARAAEVGDIFYSDKTFSSKLESDKLPIGLLYYVSVAGDYGLVMALNQPPAKNYREAWTYCNDYTPLGTSRGFWRLPTLQEWMRAMNEQWNGVKNNKLTILNQKLATISIANALLTGDYIARTSASGQTDGYYNLINLNTGVIPSSYSQYANSDSSARNFRCITRVSL